MWTALTDKLARRGRALPSDAGLHITVLLSERIADDELRAPGPTACASHHSATATASPARCGWVVGFGAIHTADIPAAVDALVTALDAAAEPPRR